MVDFPLIIKVSNQKDVKLPFKSIATQLSFWFLKPPTAVQRTGIFCVSPVLVQGEATSILHLGPWNSLSSQNLHIDLSVW